MWMDEAKEAGRRMLQRACESVCLLLLLLCWIVLCCVVLSLYPCGSDDDDDRQASQALYYHLCCLLPNCQLIVVAFCFLFLFRFISVIRADHAWLCNLP